MDKTYPRPVIEATLDLARPMLEPYCDVLTPAGSYRRSRPESRDLDLVAVPTQLQQQGDMFGGGELATRSPLTDHLVALRDEGRITFLAPPGQPQDGKLGDRMARFWFTSVYVRNRSPMVDTRVAQVPIDLYVVLPPATYAVILAIRTGSAAWNAAMMAWLKTTRDPAWRITNGALHRDGQRVEGGDTWAERDLYEIVGLPFVIPAQRETAADFQRVRP